MAVAVWRAQGPCKWFLEKFISRLSFWIHVMEVGFGCYLVPAGAAQPQRGGSKPSPEGVSHYCHDSHPVWEIRSGQGQSTPKAYTVTPRAMSWPVRWIFLQRQAAKGECLLTTRTTTISQLDPSLVNDGDFTTSVGYIFRWIISSFPISMVFENFLSFTSVIFSLSLPTDTSPTDVLTDQE